MYFGPMLKKASKETGKLSGRKKKKVKTATFQSKLRFNSKYSELFCPKSAFPLSPLDGSSVHLFTQQCVFCHYQTGDFQDFFFGKIPRLHPSHNLCFYEAKSECKIAIKSVLRYFLPAWRGHKSACPLSPLDSSSVHLFTQQCIFYHYHRQDFLGCFSSRSRHPIHPTIDPFMRPNLFLLTNKHTNEREQLLTISLP